MSLKTKQIFKIFQPIEKQILKLSELLNENSEKSKEMLSLKKLILDQLNVLAEKFENVSKENIDNYQEMKKKVTSIIEQFCTMDFDKKDSDVQDNLNKEVFIVLIEKFLHILENLEKTEIISLKQCLKDCFDYVKDMGFACDIEDLQNIKELGISIIEILAPLQIYKKNLISNLLSNKLALFCYQLCTSFKLLYEVIREQHQLNAPIYTCKKYICNRMCLCFEAIISTLEAPNPSDAEEYFEEENNFVCRIDLVLDIIKSMGNMTHEDQIKECNDLWFGIEDTFSHAMSIAQVCQPYNFKAITGSCQTILTEFETLKSLLKSDPQDPTMNNLFMNRLKDSLYRLERKINISVLTLVMIVFSDPFGALKKLIKICGTSLNAKHRTKNDLSSAIEEFDQLTDKSVQIGKFAIACCRDKYKGVQIKNCLASFESLEMELVPAISAFYLHPDNEEMRAYVKLLTVQWQIEMKQFIHTVNLIIDPSAYCQIVLDDIQDRINEMSSNLDNRQDINQSQVEVIIQRALSLSKQIEAAVLDIGQENIDQRLPKMIREFKTDICETNAASKKFLINKATASEQLRVISRCCIMLKVIKQLLPILSTIVNNSITMNTICTKSIKKQDDTIYKSAVSFLSNDKEISVNKKSSVYIRTPYSITRCKQPLSIQPANTVLRNESDVSILIPYIEKGRIMRTEWSLMYKTPKSCKSDKSVQNLLKMRNLSSVRQHLFSRDNFLGNSDVNLNTETLDLTNILDQISGLSNTLSSVSYNNNSVLNKPQNIIFSSEKVRNLNKAKIDKIKKLNECSTTGGGDAPFSLSNLENKRNFKQKGCKIDVLVKL